MSQPLVLAQPLSICSPPAARWVEVLVDCPGSEGLYTYAVPREMQVQPGDVLSVPFGAQQLGAIALQLLTEPPPALEVGTLRAVIEVVARGFFPSHYWQLLTQVSRYYHTPLIQVIRTALPPGLLSRSQRRVRRVPGSPAVDQVDLGEISEAARGLLALLHQTKTGSYSWRYLQQKVRGASGGLQELLRRGWVESFLETPRQSQPQQRQYVTLLQEQDPNQTLTPRQQGVLQQLCQAGGDLGLSQLLQLTQASESVVKSLARKGFVNLHRREVLRSEASGPDLEPDQPKPLTADQSRVLAEILSTLDRFESLLLHGVTGSGKTEVYLQAIAPILARGKSALVLVPEIGLTPQLTDRFRQRFGDRVCVYHSGLSAGERYDTWRQMLLGHPQVVIGTRSAVFAPLPNLGLIVLDEEHDSSFKQEQPMPCYHARTVAQWRAALSHCPVLLGTATPAAETWLAAQSTPDDTTGNTPNNAPGAVFGPKSNPLTAPSRYLSLPQRVHARPHPPVEVVDLRDEFHQGNRTIFSRKLQAALADLQAKGEQALLFIHRRGHSTFVSCRDCGLVMGCPHCDVPLSFHHPHANAQPLLRCHYCNYVRGHPDRCPDCHSPHIKNFGSGTQRVTQALTQLFPQLRWLRFDSDTTRTKGSHRQLLGRFAAGEADVLVGTQMLTKGIDLPRVTLVGILAADGLLHLSDYRAGERACQTLLQVAGRAGRGDSPGRVILQTYAPEHPVIGAVQRNDYPGFLAEELKTRAALNYPPYGQLVLLRLSGRDEAQVEKTAQGLADFLQPPSPSNSAYDVLGPAPAPILRVADRFRWQILLKSGLEQGDLALPSLVQLQQHCPRGVSLLVDIDPLQGS